jgi:hypothetical protein
LPTHLIRMGTRKYKHAFEWERENCLAALICGTEEKETAGKEAGPTQKLLGRRTKQSPRELEWQPRQRTQAADTGSEAGLRIWPARLLTGIEILETLAAKDGPERDSLTGARRGMKRKRKSSGKE